MVASLFGDAVDPDPVRLYRRRWWPLQPRHVTMAPCGHIHFPARSQLWREDFAEADIALQGLFMHEMTHVWQAQARGRWYLPLHRHPFCRYRYTLVPGRAFADYGIEQQAEIVRHAFLARGGNRPRAAGEAEALERLLPFGKA